MYTFIVVLCLLLTGCGQTTVEEIPNYHVVRDSQDDEDIVYQGHSLSGVSYQLLVELFGEPADSPDSYKIDAYWYIKFEDGVKAIVYNWENGRNFLTNQYNYTEDEDGNIRGNFGTPIAWLPDGCFWNVEDITEWSIGGSNSSAADRIKLIIKQSKNN